MTVNRHPWANTLDGLYEQAWARLSRGVGDRHAPARHPTLATVSARGMPQARIVVLRAVDKQAGILRVYTDLQSAKVDDLRATPMAALLVWDSSAHLQIRLQASVTILTGADAAPLWDKMPEHARMAYGSSPPPGQPVRDALAYTKSPDPASFAVLDLHVLEMDLVHLGPDHRRARYMREDGFAGQWVAP